MKKILRGIVLLMSLSIGLIPVHASASRASVSGPQKVKVGEVFTVTVNYSNSVDSAYTLDVSAGGSLSIVSSSRIVADSNGSSKVSVKANSIGSGSISVSGSSAQKTPPFAKETVSGSGLNVEVVGESSGGNTSKPKPEPKPSETAAEREARLKREEEARIEAEKKAEEERLEAERKAPLISKLELISNSNKLHGKTIAEVEVSEGVFEYEMPLLSNMENFKVSVIASSDDVTLTYDVDHEMVGADVLEKEISVRAVKDDITQEYTIKVTKPEVKTIPVKVNGSDYTVYDDETLDAYLANYSFERNVETIDGQEVPFYSRESLKVRLLINSKNEGQWFTIDENGNAVEEVVLIEGMNDDILVVGEAPEEHQKEKIEEREYKEKSFTIPESFIDLNKDIHFKTTYKAWDLNEAVKQDVAANMFGVYAEETSGFNEIVYAANNQGKFGFVKINPDATSIPVYITPTTGSVSGMSPFTIAMTVVAVMMTGSTIVLGFVLYRRSKQYNTYQ